MPHHLLRTTSGFTYISALFIVTIMGIMLGLSGTSWRMIMKREREEELLWRGMQYARAIASWKKSSTAHGGGRVSFPPKELKDLLMDPTSLAKVRHLRRLYDDPLTGKEFEVVKDPNLGIIGVRSTSNEEPLRKKNFEEKIDLSLYGSETKDGKEIKDSLKQMLKSFEDKSKYSEWEFVIRPPGAVPAGTAPTNLNLPKFGEPQKH